MTRHPHLWSDIRDGIRDVAAPGIAAIPIGLLFGAVAAGKGLSAAEVTLMSALVFAGGAQFAAIEIWSTPVPVAALAFSTLLINLRHVLMSASLARKVAFGRGARLLGFAVMADENWALAERRALRAPVSFAYWGGMGLVFWLNWVFWSALGAVIGAAMGPPERFGADFAFTALFIGLIATFVTGRGTLLVIAASGITAALVHRFIGAPWHVAAGAIAGIAAAYLAAPREDAP
ncbi:AzlC family ABC transporter permease [Salinarimonas soli]|uniref:AzlC family ABC transporter permease n=1 Tax=Salinarimonas soli TaxID=1638099 RepID=A0A5B2W1Q9_9HYPH|nr:AzlC family ABC transporter permease [Salinarimonas soli]KAA2244149.1 AzlC family ABC transporter permease [Salinarimonas soli]